MKKIKSVNRTYVNLLIAA